MTESQSGDTPPGWYADPTGQAGVRWWDGSQWTAHSAPTPSGGSAATSTGPRPRIPDTTPINTPFIWIYVLLPLIPSISILFYHPTFPRLTDASTDPLRYQQETYASFFTPAYFTLLALGLLSLAAMIVMAFFDHRALQRAGVVRPFPWPWAFLVLASPGYLVYPIGRSVVARQVAGSRALVPLWVLIGTTVIQIVVAVVWTVVVMSQVFAQIPSYR
jgi:hypothetical protein